jgi:hypothetical protein
MAVRKVVVSCEKVAVRKVVVNCILYPSSLCVDWFGKGLGVKIR